MQHHIIIGVGQGAKDVLFGLCRLRQQVQGLIAVTGKYHLVKTLAARSAVNPHADVVALDSDHRAVEANLFAKRGCHGFDVTA